MDLRDHLLQLQANLNILQEREAKFGNSAPLELVNQIADHKTAIGLTEQALVGDLAEAEWREALRPLLVVMRERTGEAAVNLTINIYEAAEPSPGPPNTRVWRWVVSIGLLVGIVAGVVQIAGVDVRDLGAYLATGRIATERADETLIVIATFHETAATKGEPHIKFKRAIEEVAEEIEPDTLRVEVEPAVLRADEWDEAEALGQQYEASIIIWGEDTGEWVVINLMNLKEPNFEADKVAMSEEKLMQVANPSADNTFIVTDLPGQLTFLAYFAVGQSFYVIEQYTQAKDIIEQGIGMLSPDAQPTGLDEAYARLGWLYQEPLADPTNADSSYTRAIELNPEYTLAYYNRGLVHYYQGDLTATLADFGRIIELNPEDASLYNNRGFVYHKQGDLTTALTDFNQAIELDPEYASAYNNRGGTYADQGALTAALVDFNRAMELDPEYASAYQNRGLVYFYQGDLTAALTDYDRAIELNPEFALAYYNRGRVYEAMDRTEEAIADIERGIELDTAGTFHQWARNQLQTLRWQLVSPGAGN
jgi:tetratricopeptide (TPR) repeat protein